MAPYHVRGAVPQDVWRVPHPTSYTLTVPTPGVPGSWTSLDLMALRSHISRSRDPWILGSCISPSHVSHIHHIPECCTARMLYYAMGVYVHAATLHPRSSCGLYITVGSQHQGSHPLDVSRVMIPLIRIPGSLDPGSLHSTSPRAAELVRCMCVPARMGTAYAYAVLHVPCIWGNARPHAPHLRSSVQVSGSLVWGNPGSMDPGILFRYHRGALVRGLRPLGLLLRPNLWTSGPTV